MGGESRIEVRGECLWADCGGADERDFAQTCRALAVECIEKDVRRVLIDATDCDPDGARAVRDAFTVMMLAGIPSGFRVALVTNVRRAYECFLARQGDLQYLHLQAGLFDDVGAASRWLASTPRPGAAADRPPASEAA